MSNLSETIIQRKRDTEVLFCTAVYMNPESALHSVGWLSPDMFNDARLADFWRAVRNGKNVAEAAMDTNTFDQIISRSGEIIGSFEFDGFAKAIAEDAYYLGLAGQLPELAKAIGQRDGDSIRKAVEQIISEKPVMDEKIPDAMTAAEEFNEWLLTDRKALYTQIGPLDEAMGGIDRQTLTLIAARPSMGKSTLGLQIARNFARQGQKVIFFSFEMSRRQLWARAACGMVGVSIKRVRSNALTEDQVDNLRRVSHEVASSYGDNLLIDDRTGQTSDQIWAKVARYKPDAIIVDHTSLVGDTDANEVRRLGRISWAGKRMAKEFNCAAIYLQQLNRGTENRDNKRPGMADLRDSGELEQNADNVIFIYRDDYYAIPNATPPAISDTELIIAKFRDGVRNINVNLHFHTLNQWFTKRGEQANVPQM
jgi:replicative DNA helicase